METGQVNERFHAEKEMVMETLFVIGAGTMGGGIAQVAALNGFTVYLYDIKQEFVDRGLKGIAGAWDKLVARGKMAAEDRDAALPRIIGTLDMQDAAKADVVIEAAVEDLDVKRSIFSKLDGIVSPGCILATNTSSLSVTAVASAEDIDTAMKLGANHPMGPLALADLIGLDVCLAIMELLRDEMGEGKYRPAPLLRKMVRAGRLGRKSGEGFFRY